MAKFKTNTNSFTIAHYILLFLVVILCISIIAWVMIARNQTAPQNNVQQNILHTTGATPCVKRAIKTVENMWENDPRSVPEKYWNIAIEYINEPISVRTYGLCQDVAFVCNPGQLRRNCDPCAVPNARAYAKSIQISDVIENNCNKQ